MLYNIIHFIHHIKQIAKKLLPNIIIDNMKRITVINKVIYKVLVENNSESFKAYLQVDKARHEKKFWVLPQRTKNECVVLLNGPSLLDLKDDILAYRDNVDIVAANFYICNMLPGLTPNFYTLLDRVYVADATDTYYSEQQYIIRDKFYAAINGFSEHLHLLVPYFFLERVKSRITNQKIFISGMPTLPHPSKRPFNSKLLENGIVGFDLGSAGLAALYVAVVAGYKKIWLAGVEMSYHKTVTIDRNCYYTRPAPLHFYDNLEAPNEPTRLPRRQTMTLDFEGMRRDFAAFEIIRDYAVENDISIINLSLNSMLDMFPKGYIGKEPFPWKP